MSNDPVVTTHGEVPPELSSQTAEIRAAASVLIERIQWMRQHGITFSGMRDLYEILGYERRITAAQYRERYRRGGIAGRIIDSFSNATWRGGIELLEDEDPKITTTFEKEVEELNKRIKIWSTLWRVDKLAQQGEYAVLLLGAPGNFDEPLKKGRPEQLVYITPFSQEDAVIQEWDTNPQSPRFALPTKYQLRRYADSMERTMVMQTGRAPAFVSPELNKPVHWTRIIHIPAEGILDNEVFGPPALERVWNLLDDLEKITGGGAEAFWLRANQGIHLNVDKDATLSETEKTALKDQADDYQHQMRRMLRTKGVSVEMLGSDVANFSNPADSVLTQIAGAKAIPKRILTGSEMGELASSQDRDNWKDQVDGRQTQYADPYLVRPFFDRLIEFSYLSTPKKYDTHWAHMQTMTEAEKAEGAGKWADVNQKQGSPVFLGEEIRDKWYKMPPLTDAQIKAEADKKQLMAPPQLQPGAPGVPGVPGETPPPPKPGEVRLPGAQPPQLQRRAAEIVEEVVGKMLLEGHTQRSLGGKPDWELTETDLLVIHTLEKAIKDGDTQTIHDLLGIKQESTPKVVEVERDNNGRISRMIQQ